MRTRRSACFLDFDGGLAIEEAAEAAAIWLSAVHMTAGSVSSTLPQSQHIGFRPGRRSNIDRGFLRGHDEIVAEFYGALYAAELSPPDDVS